MKQITLETVIDAIGHCSDKQEKRLLAFLNIGIDNGAGKALSEMVKDHIESIEEDEESDRKFEADLDNPSIDAIHSDRLKGY